MSGWWTTVRVRGHATIGGADEAASYEEAH